MTMTEPASTSLKTAHLEISRRLSGLDLGTIWPGFHPFRFALYDDNRVCFSGSEVPRDERFIGNTSINYDGERIAIWNLPFPYSVFDGLCACIVHEMFHAYQDETGSMQLPEKMYGPFYPRELRNFSLKYREDLLLASLAEKFEPGGWREFKAMRAERLGLYPAAVAYELITEALEGTATYVELQVLKWLNAEVYGKKYGRALNNLRSREKVFDVRLLSYDSGALIARLLRENGLPPVDWREESKIAFTGPATLPDLEQDFQAYFGGIDKMVQEALSRAEKIGPDRTSLICFDSYNVRSSGDYLYHPNFISIGRSEKDQKFLMGPHVTKMKERTAEILEIWRVPAQK